MNNESSRSHAIFTLILQQNKVENGIPTLKAHYQRH
jgi:hypothetical protein